MWMVGPADKVCTSSCSTGPKRVDLHMPATDQPPKISRSTGALSLANSDRVLILSILAPVTIQRLTDRLYTILDGPVPSTVELEVYRARWKDVVKVCFPGSNGENCSF